uniref:Peptidase n=1 Tax=Klebsiella pneumoniae TaxID=573 RepID=A0A8B0SVE5_KLEPN|nr:peptidase [Klebsiella pneumoniae]
MEKKSGLMAVNVRMASSLTIFDSSFESRLYSSGSDVAACTETPGLQPFAKRAEANRYLIGAFISSILERNSIGGGMS